MMEVEKLMLTRRGVRANVLGQVLPNHDRIAQSALRQASWDDRTPALCLSKCDVLFFSRTKYGVKNTSPRRPYNTSAAPSDTQ